MSSRTICDECGTLSKKDTLPYSVNYVKNHRYYTVDFCSEECLRFFVDTTDLTENIKNKKW